MKFSSKCVHAAGYLDQQFNSVGVPIYATTTYKLDVEHDENVYEYARMTNPTRTHLEKVVAELEGGKYAQAFATGLAAAMAFWQTFPVESHIVISQDLYGGTINQRDHFTEHKQLDFSIAKDTAAIIAKLKPETAAIFIETPTNPLMRVFDIRAIAQAKQEVCPNAIFLVDNTFLTPVVQNPLSLGADVVMHSATKYFGGHNDCLGGILVSNNQKLMEDIAFVAKTIGGTLSPFEAFLILRGIKTLDLRVRKSFQNAHEIAHWLEGQPAIDRVAYVGIPSHPDYALNQSQTVFAGDDGSHSEDAHDLSGGGVITFFTKDGATAKSICEQVKLITYAVSVGGTESLLTYPRLQTHADLSDAEAKDKGIDETLLRLAVGIEDVHDLIADLEQAFL